MAVLNERAIRQRLVQKFMSYDPVQITLNRPTFTETPAGGVVESDPIVIPEQTFYFVPFKRRLTEEIGRNPQSFGEDRVRDIEYIFIFIPETTDVEEGDTFTSVDRGYLRPGEYRVTFVSKREWDRGQMVARLKA